MENAVKKNIIDFLVKEGFLVLRVNSGTKGTYINFVIWRITNDSPRKSGVSDILACSPQGLFIAVECKDIGKRTHLSKDQKKFLKEVELRGGLAVVAESIQDVADRLQAYREGNLRPTFTDEQNL